MQEWWRELLGAAIVLALRLATLPRTPWESDEILFLQAVRDFDPARYHPHPPGYPLFVFLGKLVNAVLGDPFASLVTVSVISCVVGFVALTVAFRRITDDRDVAVAGALIFYCSAGMLVHGSLAMADAAAIAFLALTFAAEHPAAIGIFASAAIGCRPQLAIPLLPALAILFFYQKRKLLLFGAFTVMSLLWFVPLMIEAGGWSGLVAYEVRQAAYVAQHDAVKSRGAMSLASVAVRFVAHPWGSKWVTLPLFLCVVLGVRRVRWSPRLVALAAFTVVHLGFAILTMDPADGVRYALPAYMMVALLAAMAFAIDPGGVTDGSRGSAASLPTPGIVHPLPGSEVQGASNVRGSAQGADPRLPSVTPSGSTPTRARLVPFIAALAFAALSFWYASPILLQRAWKTSPVAAAAAYVRANVSPETIVLYEVGTRPFVEWYFPDRRTMYVDHALREFYARPDVPLVLFADGGSTASDAKVFAWSDSDAYGKLTRNVFRNITIDPIRPEERFLPLGGIYALERNAKGEEWRWLARTASFRLPDRGEGDLLLDLRLPPDAPYEFNDVQVLVDGAGQGTIRVMRGTRAPYAVPPSGHVIELRAAKTFRPDDVLHNRDTRVVSVQLVAVEQR
jgi:hypothetical protein